MSRCVVSNPPAQLLWQADCSAYRREEPRDPGFVVKRLSLSIAVLAGRLLLPQTPARLTGTVVTPAGSPISGAVVVTANSEGEEISAATGDDGQFALDVSS